MRLGLHEFLAIGMVVGVLGGAWQVGFKRLDERREQLRTDIAAKQKVLDLIDSADRDAQKLSARLGELDQQINEFDARIPRSKDEYRLQQDLERLALQTSLNIDNIRYSQPRRGVKCFEQEVEVSITGSFASFHQFVQRLEALDRIIRISSLQLSGHESADKPATGKLALTMYFDPGNITALAR